METGTVKWFNSTKGFGFITRSNGKDIFVHTSELKGGSVAEGDTVEFEVGEGKKGPCATNVSRVGEA